MRTGETDRRAEQKLDGKDKNWTTRRSKRKEARN